MSTTTLPAPFLVSPTWSFDGDDGAWSTFSLDLGTPPQSFRVLPSTASSEIWVPVPEGCAGILAGVADCGTLRGVNPFSGGPSRGFLTNSSSTWDLLGIYQIPDEQNLYGTSDNAYYGLDTVALYGVADSQLLYATSQVIGGVSTADYWLGSLGLGVVLSEFSTQTKNITSLLQTLFTNHSIPSRSFGFAAGAAYANDFGSLVLGGYDAARESSQNLTVPLRGSDNSTLGILIESIIAENVFGGSRSLLTNGNINVNVDSTISQLWLPQDVCDNFAEAFGLIYDNATQLFLVNNSIHTQLLSRNPTVTFTIGSMDPGNNNSINIALPYSAFDLNASIPIYNYSTPYFPLRVAANETQYVLGRTFLQEAYIFVDWDRGEFSVAQVEHQNSTTRIVPVLPPTNKSSTKGLAIGAIAGIAVGAGAVVIALVVIAVVLALRRRRHEQLPGDEKVDVPSSEEPEYKDEKPSELPSDFVRPGAEIEGTAIHELSEQQQACKEAMSEPLSELHSQDRRAELDDNGTGEKGPLRDHKGRGDAVYELP